MVVSSLYFVYLRHLSSMSYLKREAIQVFHIQMVVVDRNSHFFILDRDNRNTLKLIQSLKQLNLFKNVHHQTENDIKQQRIITRVYLTLLTSKAILIYNIYFCDVLGSIFVLCLFTTLRNETVIITVPKPSFTTYDSLESIHSTILRCPCSNKTITQQTFISFSPTFHQICSSSFVQGYWIRMLQDQSSPGKNDWRNAAFIEFRLLSDICQLANRTINNAIDRFLSQEFIVSSVMNENEFEKQFNASINQFYQSTLYNFDIQKGITQLIMHINQFYLGSTSWGFSNTYADLFVNTATNKTDNYTIGYVCYLFLIMKLYRSFLQIAQHPRCSHHSKKIEEVYQYHYLSLS